MSMNSNIKDKIREWLISQGYPLEMRVATSFREKGFEVLQSHFYSDPEEKTFREIDVVATAPEYTGITNVSFVIECKSSRKKPWILFTSDRTLEGRNILFSYCINSDAAREALIEKDTGVVASLPWMKKVGRVAYGLTQAFTTGADVTYKASTGVLKAAISLRRDLDRSSYSPFVFIFPCIVLEGNAFECFIDTGGNLSIEEFNNGFYFFPLQIAETFGTCIHILTIDRLSEFIQEAKHVSDSLISLLAPDAKIKLGKIKGDIG